MHRVLRQQRPKFAQRNTFLYGCLGLLSLARRVEVLAETDAPRRGRGSRAAEPAEDGDELVVLAVLGAIALARKLRSVAEHAARTTLALGLPGPTLRPRPGTMRLRDVAR